MIKHIMEHDLMGRTDLPTKPNQFVPLTLSYSRGEGKDSNKLICSTDRKEISPFNYRDFSLESLIDSENLSLLKPVGSINAGSLNSADNFDSLSNEFETKFENELNNIE